LLALIGTGQGALHTVDKPIRTPADMKGLRIRQPSAVASHIIEATGAAPVGMPASDTYTSLQRGVIDGLSFTWQPIQAFRLDELINTHTNIPFYNSTFVISMNKEKYNRLPDDLKKVIDDNSGAELAAHISKVFDVSNAKAMAAAKEKGDIMIDIPDPLNDPDWRGPLMEGSQHYLDEVNATGLDADNVYEKAKAASSGCMV
jgi:TRAP-type C4-dicarboxylate transport system substrate-binding protein